MKQIIYGIHAVLAVLKNNPKSVQEIYLVQERYDQRFKSLMMQIKQANIIIKLVNRKWLDKQVEGAVHQGIIAIVYHQLGKQFQEKYLLSLLDNKNIQQHSTPLLLLVLDGVTDPHNLGACLRCADAAGVNAVIVPRNRSANFNATVSKVASGAAETIPLIRVTNLVRTLNLLHQYNFYIIGTDIDANYHLYQHQFQLTRPIALVMGAECNGMRSLTKKNCDTLIRIPMAGSVSSLNIAVAVGIFLFEAVRQRLYSLIES
ncbi:23S rRNA (guanosine(2251)-2'-O)-methyltransferase RlmB [Candidatus Palibaumannia cicadellinicola]|uniref:23S rRNA (guanosine-2'-O-)-methyltransferase RlmB n=1 Tax=Candidatus Palibaumannia cicadellinicola TaxID=186490 RepID=A0A0K2BLP0_9GAMM|nr:23S rRNA (guanosine(2251)-2'-O)-methyltransferase RlmB [Candidatus Baumannia cicadellinicola]AKZ66102.1 23S rRNA (guanosine-2'-O-) -methyltransferase rlmB [Candidatus Baumannia cicadellinicola]